MRWLLLTALALVGCFGSLPALAEKKVALVIGNSAYAKVAPLANPTSDADAISELFKAADFSVVVHRRDVAGTEMRRAVRDFFEAATSADVAVVYYAGHGIEVDGINYLIPIDASLKTDRDVYDETVSLERVLQSVEPAKRLRLVILDACRDNPFVRSMKRTFASRAIMRGLASVEPTKANTLIAFAAKSGSTAEDGDRNHSPFTKALLAHLTTPGLDLRKALGRVRDDVIIATNDQQEPFVYGSLGGSDVVLVSRKADEHAGISDPSSAVRADYELAERVGSIEAWTSFINKYEKGYYVELATAQRKKISAEEKRLAGTEKSRQDDLSSSAGNKAETTVEKPASKTRIKAASLNSSGSPTARPRAPVPERPSGGYASFCNYRFRICVAKAGTRERVVRMCHAELPRCAQTGVWNGPSGKSWTAAGR